MKTEHTVQHIQVQDIAHRNTTHLVRTSHICVFLVVASSCRLTYGQQTVRLTKRDVTFTASLTFSLSILLVRPVFYVSG
jgi:hypothetical protein